MPGINFNTSFMETNKENEAIELSHILLKDLKDKTSNVIKNKKTASSGLLIPAKPIEKKNSVKEIAGKTMKMPFSPKGKIEEFSQTKMKPMTKKNIEYNYKTNDLADL